MDPPVYFIPNNMWATFVMAIYLAQGGKILKDSVVLFSCWKVSDTHLLVLCRSSEIPAIQSTENLNLLSMIPGLLALSSRFHLFSFSHGRFCR